MDQYVGEIRMFAGQYAPVGWALCNGQLVSIAEYQVLYMVIGTTYGGDGQNTFALPDLRGRIPIHMGQSPSFGTTYTLGQSGGTETVTLTLNQVPAHTHSVRILSTDGSESSPANGVLAKAALASYASSGAAGAAMAPGLVGGAGGSQAHDNMMPFQCLNFIIATEGLFPPQS